MRKNLPYTILLFLMGIIHFQTSAQSPLLNSYSAAKATVYLDFDGAEVEGTLWNEKGKIIAEPSGLSPASVTWIHKMISDHFKLFNLNITTDPTVYERAPVRQRIRVIITPNGNWYGPATGVSAIGSFAWGDDTPAWVFMHDLSDNPAFIATSATHQIGHTLGLQHQSVYDSYGIMITELSGGENNIFSNEAPLMGIPFYKDADWKNGHPSTGSQNIQSDTARIAGAPNYIGYRKKEDQEDADLTTVKIARRDGGYLELTSSGNYSYRLFDVSGRLLTQGILKTGYNEIRTSPASQGVYVLQWSGGSVTGSRKIIH
jgi:hypothetical protein